ncbi:uncharacterized protein LOC100876813 [Megachile rotundata]|uniref:uncharacterized protein LOC100876813 n=1 Tax=Megachile rotundata TaxID=143995 RepID=UPI003FD6791E
MLRLLVLASLGAVISASFLPHHLLGYPRSLQSLFGAKREAAVEKKEREVCNNTECRTIANLLKDSMDETVDPCDDFYEFACGKWSKGNPLPENKTEWSLWAMVSDKIENQVLSIIEAKPKPSDLFAVKLAKKWYESCMDTEMIEKRGAEPIISTLWRHGGWPLIMEEGEWDDRIYHWQIVDDHFARLLGFNSFHDVYYRSLTYGGNETILIETAPLPLGLRKVLDVNAALDDNDSIDEKNESGEGSQEAGSEERGKEQQKKKEEEENEEENKESENEESENEEGENEVSIKSRRVIKRKNHKRLGHGRHVYKKGTKKRTRRDIEKKIVHRLLHQLKKANKGKSKHHLSISKSHVKKQNHESKKKLHGKMTKGKKRLGHGKKNNKAMKKHVHENNLKKKLNVHNNHAQKKINHRVHHVANKMKLANQKKLMGNGTEDTDNDMDNDIENDEKVDKDDETKNNGKEENTENEESNDDADNDVDKNDDEEDEENEEDNKDDAEDENDENKDDDAEENDENKDDDAEENDEDKNDNEEDEDETNDEENEDKDEEETEESEEEVDLEELRAEYKEFMLNVSLILSKARGIEIPKETLMKDIDELLEFSIKIGELSLKDEEPVNMTLREFQEEYDTLKSTTRNGKINWVKKVQKLFAEAGVDIEDDVNIAISNPKYIKEIHTLLDKTPSRTIVNYIHWMFISTAIMAGPRELRSLAENWLGRRMHFSSRKSECIQMVDLNDIVAYEYVQQYFSEETAKTARDMIDDIQKEVEYQIKESTWMNDDTKHFILDKLVNMKNLVGYPSWYKNTTMVKAYFQGLTIGPSYYENVLNYVRHKKWRNLRQILEPIDTSIEYLDPLMLNAFFMPTENSISITAADFQSPFFALNRPWAVNFGIIGLVMGHEVNHGFDDEGHLYDHGGNLMEWLSAMADAYNQRAECFVDQFNRYSIIQGENYTIENYGNQTAGENIADTMGMLAVFRAYKRRQRECGNPDPALPGLEKFNNDQIFFLSFANLWCETIDRESLILSAKYDVHSPGRLRVIGSVSNSEDFAKAFNCPVNSPMNPKKKCNIWV